MKNPSLPYLYERRSHTRPPPGRFREPWFDWVDFSDRVDAGIAALREGPVRGPAYSANAYLKAEVYRLVIRYLENGKMPQLKYVLEQWRPDIFFATYTCFDENPFHSVLLALRNPYKGNITREIVSKFGRELIHAFHHRVRPELLIAFLHQYSNSCPIPRYLFDEPILESGCYEVDRLRLGPTRDEWRCAWDAAQVRIIFNYKTLMYANRGKKNKVAISYIKDETYRLVLSYKLRKSMNILKESIVEANGHPRSPSFNNNPYYWTLHGLLEDVGTVSIATMSKASLELAYANSCKIHPNLVIGFIYQLGGAAGIRTKLNEA